LEARTRVFNPETWKSPGAALILLTHMSTRHDWQTVRENSTHKFPLVPGQSYILIPKWMDVRSVLPNSHIHQSSLRAGVDQGEIISPDLFSLYVNDMPSPSRHVELAHYADDTAIITTSRQPALLVKYLETSQRPRTVVE